MEDMPVEKLYIMKNEAFAAKNIGVLTEAAVSAIDPDLKTVTLAGGTVYPYDRLMLATGALPFVPEIKGMPMDGIFTLRTIEDAQRIKTWCRNKKNIVISGGGLLGIETANALRNFCENITIIDTNPFLLNRQLDSDGAQLLRKFLEEKGL